MSGLTPPSRAGADETRSQRRSVCPCTASFRVPSRPSRLLGQLAPADAQQFEPVLAHCPTLRLEAGTSVTPAELSRAYLLVVEDGVAAIATRPELEGRQMTVAIARPGDLLVPPHEGECLSALTGAVVTLLPALVCRALLTSPVTAALVVDRLVDAIADRQESLARFGAVEHVKRVREKLLQLARAHGRVASDGVHLDLPLTHELIAQTTGSARETVTVALAELRREGFLVREGRSYRLTVPPELLELPVATSG